MLFNNRFHEEKMIEDSIEMDCVDETMEMLRKHFDISEDIQAVHRGRLIYGKPKTVIFLSNVSLGK